MDHDLEVFPDPAAATVHPMPVEEEDLAAAARAYAAAVPARFDPVHLGPGPDKQEPLARLLSADCSIPAGRVQAGHSLVLADAQAAERVRGAALAHRNGDER